MNSEMAYSNEQLQFYGIVSFSCISAFDCFNNSGINWADVKVCPCAKT